MGASNSCRAPGLCKIKFTISIEITRICDKLCSAKFFMICPVVCTILFKVLCICVCCMTRSSSQMFIKKLIVLEINNCAMLNSARLVVTGKKKVKGSKEAANVGRTAFLLAATSEASFVRGNGLLLCSQRYVIKIYTANTTVSTMARGVGCIAYGRVNR